jgi:hypothetical protein
LAEDDDAGLSRPLDKPAAPGWRLTGRFDWHELDGDVVVRMRDTAQILCLSPAASALIAALGRAPASAPALGDLCGELDGADDADRAAADFEQSVAATLIQLRDLGLVEEASTR